MGSEGKLPNWQVSAVPLWWSFHLARTLSNCAALSAATALGERIQKLVGTLLVLLLSPSQFCKQVRDYGVQKHQHKGLPIYSKLFGTKGEIQASQKFTLILCREVFLLMTLNPMTAWVCNLTSWAQIGWPGQGTRWNLSGRIWKRPTPLTELTGMRWVIKSFLQQHHLPSSEINTVEVTERKKTLLLLLSTAASWPFHPPKAGWSPLGNPLCKGQHSAGWQRLSHHLCPGTDNCLSKMLPHTNTAHCINP